MMIYGRYLLSQELGMQNVPQERKNAFFGNFADMVEVCRGIILLALSSSIPLCHVVSCHVIHNLLIV